jgi:hypothetical protein
MNYSFDISEKSGARGKERDSNNPSPSVCVFLSSLYVDANDLEIERIKKIELPLAS